MRVKRDIIQLKTIKEQDDSGYMDATPQERLAAVWELTAELWSLTDKESAERRLQRNIIKLIMPKGLSP